jgi:hypothetical protein
MDKRLVRDTATKPASAAQWLDLAAVVVEMTSEDADRTIEDALLGDDADNAHDAEGGWRAGEPGVQTIRLLFDQPQDVRRIALCFVERTATRTQEFVLRWSPEGKPLREIVRQQWNFSPAGATQESEDYAVELRGVKVLELTINPNVSGGDDYASLQRLRIA